MLSAGARLGPYEIVSPLGAGGMGEVYRAKDTRLGRDVAIKVLPEHLSRSPDARARFEREARAVAALSHPNILAIHDFGIEADTAYAVTELLEGETLRVKLGDSALPLRKAVDHARQIASGLAAAHEKGIVHRDLKPDNVFVTRDGRVKILDFGLAKVGPPEIGSPLTQSPTVERGTLPGTVMGTMGYMSPEQVRGAPADARSDLFAFGAILYEMLCGRRAFGGDTAADTMTAILREDPPDLSAPGRTPPLALDRIVRHCLEKNPEERFQSARDIAFALEAFSGTSSAEGQVAPVPGFRPAPRRGRVAAAVVGSALLVAAFVAGLALGRGRASRVVTFQQITHRPEMIFQAAFAPDGRTIVFSSALRGTTPEIFTIRPEYPEPSPLGLPETQLLAVSSNGELAVLTRPRYIGHRLFEGTLARVPLGGGAPREILDRVRQADWSPDGADLAIIRDVDGMDRLEYPPGTVLHEAPGYVSDLRFSPRGDRIAFFEHPYKYDDRGSVNVVDLAGRRTLLSDGYWGLEGIAWSPGGDEVLFSAGTGYSNFAIFAVTQGGTVRSALQSAGGITIHAVLPDGRWLVTRDDIGRRMLALAPGAAGERDLSWLELSRVADLSADGTTLLFTEEGTVAGVNYAACIRKTDGSPVVRLGEGGALKLSPDGRLALAVVLTSPAQAVVYPTGPGEPVRLERGGIEQYGSGDWLPDGRSVLLCGNEPGRATRCFVQEVPGGIPRPVTPEGTSQGLIAPDASRVLARDAMGAWNLYPIAGGGPAPVPSLTPDDSVSRWSADGRSLLVFQGNRIPARVEWVELATGRRTLFKEVAPADLAGVMGTGGFSLSDDERSYAYDFNHHRSSLFVVDGVR